MLDSETKRRIDTARDILVGKVPDPKSQVEQITIALIYKFMDDMDAQAEELGGKRKFFAGQFAQYGWAKLMAQSVSGEERIALYADGMVKMPQNPGVPKLFRDIFKNAFLPYRDAETLKLFLKTINEFEYDHSERLGDAFEYLLSVLGSQGQAGQFRTPRHIIDFIVAIVNPKKNETVLDPACGTAGFLISAYKHILLANSSAKETARANGTGEAALHTSKIPLARGDLLTPDERKKLADNFRGYDISPDMVRLSLVNMYLHGFTDPHVYEYDTLTSQDRWNEMADVILANPPFMSPKGGIKPHNRFSVQSKRSEVLFVDYMAEHLTPGGRAGVIVPEGIIFQSQTAYVKLRKMLVEYYLIGVISLPSGVFQPYTNVKTSILIFDRSESKRNPDILFSDVRHDGFSLSVRRSPTDKNDLPTIFKDFAAFYQGEDLSAHSWRASRAAILANDCNLSGGRYKPKSKAGDTEMVPLNQLLTQVDREEMLDRTREYRFLGVKWYAKGLFIKEKVLGSDVKASKAYRVESGDFVYNRLFAWKGSFALADESVHGCHVSNEFPCFRIYESRVVPGFLLQLFTCERLWHESFSNSIGTSTTSRNRLKEAELLAMEIPLPPLEVQKEIVAEIEGFQRVIDGASAVLDHYRPHIPIQPDWPMVRLEDACEIQRGKFTHRPRNEPRFYGGVYPFIQTGDVVRASETSGKVIYTQTLNEEGLSVSRLFQPPIVLITIAANIGDTAVLDFPCAFPDSVVGLIPKDGVDVHFLELTMRTKKEHLNELAPQAAQKNINNEILKEVEIPLPPWKFSGRSCRRSKPSGGWWRPTAS